MGIFDFFGGGSKPSTTQERGLINNGPQKKDGGHDHRHNRDKDRTPAQKKGDEARKK